MNGIKTIDILLIEDDADDAYLTRDILSELVDPRYHVEWIETAEAGFNALISGEYDAALIDNFIGGRTGIDIVSKATEKGVILPMIMLTGASTQDVDMAALEAGASDFLEKSKLTPELLDRSIRYAITSVKTRAELIRARDVAESANRSKSEFIANISHELRTPLNAIIGFSDIMAQEINGPLNNPHYTEYISHIRESGSHLLSVINDILDISKIEAGKWSIVEEEVFLTELFNSSVQMMTPHAQTARVNLQTKIERDAQVLIADHRSIKQIIINLLSNAIKFTGENGQISLTSQLDEEGRLIIAVSDDGVGVPEDKIDLILEPFEQADNTQSRNWDGLGLGLPIVNRLAQMQGGQIKITSKLGSGTTVCVTFDASRNVIQGKHQSKETQAA